MATLDPDYVPWVAMRLLPPQESMTRAERAEALADAIADAIVTQDADLYAVSMELLVSMASEDPSDT